MIPSLNRYKICPNKLQTSAEMAPIMHDLAWPWPWGSHIWFLDIDDHESSYIECKKTYAKNPKHSPRWDRSQTSPISTEHDLTYDALTRWPDMKGNIKLQDVYEIDRIRGCWKFGCSRTLFTRGSHLKNIQGLVRPPPSPANPITKWNASLH